MSILSYLVLSNHVKSTGRRAPVISSAPKGGGWIDRRKYDLVKTTAGTRARAQVSAGAENEEEESRKEKKTKGRASYYQPDSAVVAGLSIGVAFFLSFSIE